MKRVVMPVVLTFVLAVGLAYAQTELDEVDYQKLDKMHNKIIRMKKEMDRLMRDIVSTYPTQGAGGLLEDIGQDVKVDVSEDDKNMIVRADLPGMDKDKIDIALERNRYLKISGTREVAKKETGPNVIKQERMSGRFERALELPSEGQASGITAAYKNGVLEIVIPKQKEASAEKIKIKVN